MQALSPTTAPLTMTSREIAELTGKRHDHVVRDIRNMLEALELTGPSFGGSYTDSTGRALPLFHLPKDLTLTLVAGYSVPLRHRIVTRWIELEAQAEKPKEQDALLPTVAALVQAVASLVGLVDAMIPQAQPAQTPDPVPAPAKRRAKPQKAAPVFDPRGVDVDTYLIPSHWQYAPGSSAIH